MSSPVILDYESAETIIVAIRQTAHSLQVCVEIKSQARQVVCCGLYSKAITAFDQANALSLCRKSGGGESRVVGERRGTGRRSF